MRAVTHGHFLSLDKEGHTTQSVIAENPMLHANFIAPRFIEPELLLIEALHCGNRNFRPFFATVTMTLTFIYKLDPYSLEI